MKKRPIKHFQRIIEDTNWDNELIKQESTMNGLCWLLVAIAALFFSVILGGIIIR